MDDSNSTNGEVLSINFSKNGRHVVTLDREPIPARNEPIVPFPQEPDYAIVQPVTAEEFIPSIGRWISVGGIVMVASFGAAIGLSTVLKFDTPRRERTRILGSTNNL